MRLGTVVVSIATFAGSLGVVAYVHPGIKVTTAVSAAAQPATSVTSFSNSGTRAGSARSSSRQQASVAPLVRTRGS